MLLKGQEFLYLFCIVARSATVFSSNIAGHSGVPFASFHFMANWLLMQTECGNKGNYRVASVPVVN